ncbi:MAG: NrfJ [Oligoflexus sp.]
MQKNVFMFMTCFGILASSTTSFAKPDNNQQGFAAAREMTHQLLSDSEEGTSNYSGIVSEVFDSGGYSYIRFKSADKEYWAASNAVSLKVGDHIVLNEVYPMHGFHSKSLNRTFDFILFTGQVMKKSNIAKK